MLQNFIILMNLAPEQKMLKVQAKRNYITIAFTIIWLFIFCIKIKDINAEFLKQDYQSKIFPVGMYMFTIYLVYQTIWSLIGETTFSISGRALIVESSVLFLKRTNTYTINHITGIKLRSNVPSSSYWGFLDMRFSDYQATVLCFNYNNKEVMLGLNLSPFDLETLKQWIS